MPSSSPARKAEPWREPAALAERPEYAELIESGQLRPVWRREGLIAYTRQIWQRRHFLAFDARSRVLTQHSQNRLGSFWLVGKPLLDAAFYYLFFGMILKVDRGMENFAAYVIIGILMFQFTTTAIGGSANLLISGRALMRSFHFPRASLVVSAALRDMFGLTPVMGSLLVAIILIPPHVMPSWTWLLVPVVVLMQMLLNLGIRFLVARMGAAVPDLAFALSFFNRILLYGSGVIFPIEHFIQNPVMAAILLNNPLFIIIDMYRSLLISHVVPDAHQWLVGSAWAVGLTVVGYVVFWRGEERYGRL